MYATDVEDRRLHFAVSGMLWKRSLVMIDKETDSLWSHLLGRCMRGELEGTTLEMIPSMMTDWETWKALHPKTTVLNMRRTSRNYEREFYQDPKQFVVGLADGATAVAYPFDQLVEQPVVNDTFAERPVLVVFERKSGTAVVFERGVGDRVLSFARLDDYLIDAETGSKWNAASGTALEGTLKGTQLKQLAGVASFRRAWENFHPESEYWSADE